MSVIEDSDKVYGGPITCPRYKDVLGSYRNALTW